MNRSFELIERESITRNLMKFFGNVLGFESGKSADVITNN